MAAIALGQEQGANRDPKKIVEQAIRKLDNECIQAQIHADAAALERIYADDFIADDFIGVGPSGTVRIAQPRTLTSCLLIECKSEVDLQRTEIAKAETGQMNNATAWFKTTAAERKWGRGEFIPIRSAAQCEIIPTPRHTRRE